jgi:hypothetical protein
MKNKVIFAQNSTPGGLKQIVPTKNLYLRTLPYPAPTYYSDGNILSTRVIPTKEPSLTSATETIYATPRGNYVVTEEKFKNGNSRVVDEYGKNNGVEARISNHYVNGQV